MGAKKIAGFFVFFFGWVKKLENEKLASEMGKKAHTDLSRNVATDRRKSKRRIDVLQKILRSFFFFFLVFFGRGVSYQGARRRPWREFESTWPLRLYPQHPTYQSKNQYLLKRKNI